MRAEFVGKTTWKAVDVCYLCEVSSVVVYGVRSLTGMTHFVCDDCTLPLTYEEYLGTRAYQRYTQRTMFYLVAAGFLVLFNLILLIWVLL